MRPVIRLPNDPTLVDRRERGCFESLDPALPRDWRRLAAALAVRWREAAPARVALAGGQGAGKSTLARAIVAACAYFDLRAVATSIDDFYRTRAARQRLGRDVHPLLATRGPPGTHDVGLCESVLDALGRAGEVAVPVFDKGVDDRADRARRVMGPADVALLEGWCVGARPQSADALREPVNGLEAEADADGRWRRHVNDALGGPYARLFAGFDCLIFLRVPSLAAVRRWRLDQEADRPPDRRLDADEVERFVAHYERLTRWMQEDLPDRADVLVDLDETHRVRRTAFR